jgi:CheY-like chemotaxis protein
VLSAAGSWITLILVIGFLPFALLCAWMADARSNWVEIKIAKVLLWWRRGEIRVPPWANHRQEFLDHLSEQIGQVGGSGSPIAPRVDYAIERINQRISCPDAAVDYHTYPDLALAKYGLAKLPPIRPSPPAWPPHKWSAKLQRWEPVDAAQAERERQFNSLWQEDTDDPSADGDTATNQTHQTDNGLVRADVQAQKPNQWVGAVVSASKSLATNKPEMQAFLSAIVGQQSMYGYPTDDLEELSKQLDQANDLQEFLRAISQSSTDLKVADNGAARQTSKEPKLRTNQTVQGTILLVQGDGLRALNARGLRSRGYSVIEASNGTEALEVLEQKNGIVDLVVSDEVPPDRDGPTLLETIRSRNPNLKIILVSGYAKDAFDKNLLDNQQVVFLPKPFALGQLVAAVRKAMSQS